MTVTSVISRRVEALLGATVVATTPVAGGDICSATRLRLSDGRHVFTKSRPQVPGGFFRSEAAGLAWLAETHTVAVPEVLGVDDRLLVLSWVEEGRPTPEAAEEFGRRLARLHASGATCFGTPAGEPGWIGSLPLPNRSAGGWPEFYATQRLLPYLKLARDRGAVDDDDAAAVDTVVRRLAELAGPAEAPARLHGDLWSGNVLWGAGGTVWLVDPAAHGGHRETDLAMLALFGLPQLPRVLDAYAEVAPLGDGWRERVPLHQLFPLLVHACLFGSGYGARAGEAARSLC